MPTPEREPSDEFSFVNFLSPAIAARRLILRTTVIVTFAVALLGGLYFLLQPSRWTAMVGFRPIFDGADTGLYPNRLRFSGNDIIDPSITDQVFESSHLQDFCTREQFRAGLTVQQTSMDLVFLDLDYQARLSDARMSSVERQRVEEEYLSRRQALPVKFRLMFIRAPECSRLPQEVASKVLVELLRIWAEDSENKRGVMRLRRPVLSPGIFDRNENEGQSFLVRADLVRSALIRVIASLNDIQGLPGSELVRLPGTGLALVEVRAKLEDLVQAQLDPLIETVGQRFPQEAQIWVRQSLKIAETEQKVAQEKADTYVRALREYSGVQSAPPASAPAVQKPQPADVQAMTAQIEGTFIDRIVTLSAASTAFRQELTRQLVTASLAAADRDSAVEHYRALLASIAGPQRPSASTEEMTQQLAAIVTAAKDLTRQFNSLYEEFSRVSLRVGGLMYRIEDPVSSTTLRAFGRRELLIVIAAVFLLTPIILTISILIRYRWREANASEAAARR